MNNTPIEFLEKMRSEGLEPPTDIVPGKLTRFPGEGKRTSNKAGWCVLFEDGRGGCFGDWSSGLNNTWQSDGRNSFAKEENQKFREKVNRARLEAQREKEKCQKLAADKAQKIWNESKPVQSHPYLDKKKIGAHEIRCYKESLAVPLYHGKDIASLQFIEPDGNKKFLSDGRTKDCHFVIGNVKTAGKVLIAEGFASGATVHEATNYPVLVAFNCHNLESTAQMASKQYPRAEIIICADDDFKTDGNPGLSKANDAALVVEGKIAVPKFDGNRPEQATDFNDIAALYGLDSVAKAIEEATYPEWPAPENLSEDFSEMPYPLESLPNKIQLAVKEVADFVQAPISLVACSALGSVSLAVQGHVDVARDNVLVGPCGLFILIMAESGERKTASDKHFIRPILQYEKEQAEEMKPLLVAYKVKIKAIKAQCQGIESQIKKLAAKGNNAGKIENLTEDLNRLESETPKKPKVFRSIYNDATIEALKSNLANDFPCGGIMSNEAGIVLGGYTMNEKSITRSLSTYNILWDGGTIRTDRQTTESSEIKSARFTISLMVQEEPLKQFANSSGNLARGIGLFARFLIAWPQSNIGKRPYKEAPEYCPHLETFSGRICELLKKELPFDDKGNLAPIMLNLTPEAKQVWKMFHDQIEKQLGASGKFGDIRDVASKAADNIARLAALFHVFENGVGGDIQPESVQSAGAIVLWHLNESTKFFGRLMLSGKEGDMGKLNDWLIDYCRRNGCFAVSRRYIQQNVSPRRLRDKENLDRALKGLQELKRVLMVFNGKKKIVLVNPKLIGGDSQSDASVPF